MNESPASRPFPKPDIEAIWAPWRVEYFQTGHCASSDFLSEAATSSDENAHLVITRKKSAFLLMNKYPYSAGHLMAVPYRKGISMEALTDAEVLDLWHLCALAQKLLAQCVQAQGFNVGWNIGRAGGAGVEDHLHIHIVPRWNGDSNFMAVVAGTRVIPEGLQPLYLRLRETLPLIENAG